MAARQELLEAALENLPEGVALLNAAGQVVFWNHAAESITGFPCIEIVGRPTPWAVEPLLQEPMDDRAMRQGPCGRGMLVHAQHKLGREIAAMLHVHLLRDSLGARIGRSIIFRAAENWDALPHGDTSPDSGADETQERLEERVEEQFHEFESNGTPLSLLWITVDQAADLRRTHGARAVEAMLERVERILTNGLHGGEEIGRWGDDEFLMLAHEPAHEALRTRAQTLAGLARTTDFRWWGDRVSLTVSVGAALAQRGETLVQVLRSAEDAMHASVHAGGNHITLAPGRRACSPL
ncbi:MAG TPA: diguanylate cyclase [Terracidiphilus sp.]|nr:diguanylate cyclase [Terracidiphilus sp.]